jgi:Protein of unknown function (DUF2726)
MVRLLDRYEELAHGEIAAVAKRYDLSVFVKVRVEDALKASDHGVTGELLTYALKAHFDFVVCRNKYDTAYAIEFDGASHSHPDAIVRDQKKDRICEIAEFPILRTDSRYLSKAYGHLTLLAWLMEVYELQLAFDEAQAAGQISWEEDFDPFWLMSLEPGEPRFPYSFGARPRHRLQRLAKAGRILDPTASSFVGRAPDGLIRGVQFIRVTEDTAVSVRASMRPQRFPAPLPDLLDEILAVELAAQVDQYLAGQVGAAPLSEVMARWNRLKGGLRMCHALTTGLEGVTA